MSATLHAPNRAAQRRRWRGFVQGRSVGRRTLVRGAEELSREGGATMDGIRRPVGSQAERAWEVRTHVDYCVAPSSRQTAALSGARSANVRPSHMWLAVQCSAGRKVAWHGMGGCSV
jgi:hypothetical protein